MEEMIRIIRVLEYKGPRKWVEDTLAKSYITKGESPFGLDNPRSIKELSREEKGGD